MRRYALRDDQWDRIKDTLPGREGHVGVTAKDNRLFVEAVIYRFRAGIPWRDLPAEFGAWDAVYNRLSRWVHSGSLERLFELLTAAPELGDVRRVLIDSTIIRAHQHAAGAPRRKKSAAQRGRRRSRVWAAAGAG